MLFKHLLAAIVLFVASPSLFAAEFSTSTLQKQLKAPSSSSQNPVVVDIVTNGPANTALKELQTLGLVSHSVLGNLISGLLATNLLETARQLESVNQIRVNRTITARGDLTSEGDKALRAANARQSFSVDGTGISVAVISDSYNCLGGEAQDRAADDLPLQTTVIEEAFICDGLVDEGRAIMHLVHDIAPGANLLFFSGTNGYARTANGILQLIDEHDVDIIIDDAKSLAAPFFQKGVLVQAVEQAVNRGVTYITAAGNSARLSYQSEYRDTYNPALDINAHDFDPGNSTDIYQRIELPEGAAISLILQWDSPAFSVSGQIGASTDLDIHLVNGNEAIVAESTEVNIGRDPIEILEFYNPEGSGESAFNLLISKAIGPNPTLVKYILFNRFDGNIAEYASNSGTIFGHANARAAITVGAGNYEETPAYGSDSPLLEYFSSAGGDTPWLFDPQGNRIETPYTPKKPDIIAPDNVNTEFDLGEDTDGDGNSNFRGTSAAAPHVAGVAALMLQLNSQLNPTDIKQILQSTAVDVTYRNDTQRTQVGAAYDLDSGYGLIDAQKALSMVTAYNASAVAHVSNSASNNIELHQAANGGGIFDPRLTLLFVSLLLLCQWAGNRSENTQQLS